MRVAETKVKTKETDVIQMVTENVVMEISNHAKETVLHKLPLLKGSLAKLCRSKKVWIDWLSKSCKRPEHTLYLISLEWFSNPESASM